MDDDTTVFNDTQNDVEPQSDSTNDPIEGAVNKETVMEAANIDTTEEAANNETIEQTNDMIEEESVRKDTKIQLFKCSKCDKSFFKEAVCNVALQNKEAMEMSTMFTRS